MTRQKKRSARRAARSAKQIGKSSERQEKLKQFKEGFLSETRTELKSGAKSLGKHSDRKISAALKKAQAGVSLMIDSEFDPDQVDLCEQKLEAISAGMTPEESEVFLDGVSAGLSYMNFPNFYGNKRIPMYLRPGDANVMPSEIGTDVDQLPFHTGLYAASASSSLGASGYQIGRWSGFGGSRGTPLSYGSYMDGNPVVLGGLRDHQGGPMDNMMPQETSGVPFVERGQLPYQGMQLPYQGMDADLRVVGSIPGSQDIAGPGSRMARGWWEGGNGNVY